MKLVVLADLHGRLPESLPAHDVVCIAGDILESCDTYRLEQWFRAVTDKPILWIPGNHDVALKGWNSKIARVRCLHGNTITIDGITFGGFVWNNCEDAPILADCFIYCTPNMDGLRKKVAKIPKCDVLLSHSPPMGVLDKTHGGTHIGIPGLIDWAKKNNCRYIFCGHVHEHGGKIQDERGVLVINAARKMLVIDI